MTLTLTQGSLSPSSIGEELREHGETRENVSLTARNCHGAEAPEARGKAALVRSCYRRSLEAPGSESWEVWTGGILKWGITSQWLSETLLLPSC